MALRKRGKNGTWHAYFRTVVSLPDGKLKYATTTVNLHTDDLLTARALEAELMAKNKAARIHQRAMAKLRQLEVAAGVRSVSDLPQPIIREKRVRRLKLSDWHASALRYRDVSTDTVKIFSRFVREVSVKYFDEVTPELALAYLHDRFQGKTFNNNKTALNSVFRLLLVDAGMKQSPFSVIPNRRFDSEHQRPFTDDEFTRIYQSAPEPWKSASLIAWYTGLRQKDVFLLRWDQIDGDVITTTPSKTARFGRSVQIPVHPQLAEVLRKIPHSDERVLGAWPYNPNSISFRRAFGEILKRLGIEDNIHGIVNFNSFRDSFVTRCDAAGIPRHAIRGIVGHTEDDTTDLYSHDLTSARLIQDLPYVKLEDLPKT